MPTHNANPTLEEYAVHLLRELLGQVSDRFRRVDAPELVRQALREMEDAIEAGEAPHLPCPICEDTGICSVDDMRHGEHYSRTVTCYHEVEL